MIRAFKNGRSTMEIANFLEVPLWDVVNTIYDQYPQIEWTTETVARFSNVSEEEINKALLESRSIYNHEPRELLRLYAEAYRQGYSCRYARDYIVGYAIGALTELYTICRKLELLPDDNERTVAFRRMDLLLFMHENGLSFEDIHLALGISPTNAAHIIDSLEKKFEHQT